MPDLTRIGDVNATTSSVTASPASQSPAAHASTVAGDLVVIPTTSKPSGSSISTPGGWNAVTQRVLGTGASAETSGLQRFGLFWLILPGSYSAPSLSVSGTGCVLASGAITFRPGIGWTAEVTDSGGSDTSSDADLSVTGDTVLPFVEDDWVLVVVAIPDNTPTFDANGASVVATGATFDPLDSAWNTGGNGGTFGFAQRTQSLSAKCLSGPATAVPSLSGVGLSADSTGGMVFYRLHPVHLPWHILGIDGTAAGNHFKLQAARDGAGSTYEKTRAEIVAGYYEDPYLIAVGTDQEWCRFQVRLDSATTAGTDYPRSELREMQVNGTSDASWDTASGTHRMRGVMRVMDLPPVKPTVVFAQVHGGASDIVQLVTEKNATSGLVEVKCRINGTSSGLPVFETDYQVGDVHEWMIEVIDGATLVYWDDLYHARVNTTAPSSATAYFKVGCYTQSNETIDSGTEYMAVDVRDVRVWHTGYSGDTGAPPAVFAPPLPSGARRYRHLLVR